jgi:hypothetical protein
MNGHIIAQTAGLVAVFALVPLSIALIHSYSGKTVPPSEATGTHWLNALVAEGADDVKEVIHIHGAVARGEWIDIAKGTAGPIAYLIEGADDAKNVIDVNETIGIAIGAGDIVGAGGQRFIAGVCSACGHDFD